MTDRDTARSNVDASPLDDIREEAERLGRETLESGLQLRLMGGMAVYLTSPTVRQPAYQRPYGDLDFVVAARDKRAAAALLTAAGYVPEKMFNALHGAQRLNFQHPGGSWPIDVVVDEVRMSHRIDLRGRLSGAGPTLLPADLLLTKLQIWEINPKDLGDIICLLADHEIADGDGAEVIDLRRILALTSVDWGLSRTVARNLEKAAEEARHRGGTQPRSPAAQVATLLEAIRRAPKSLGWKARARVGERVRWYETPEDVRH